jgi:hypothetical protein
MTVANQPCQWVFPQMNGQWIGAYSGTNSGLAVLDLDKGKNEYTGVVFAYDNNPALPKTLAHVTIPAQHHGRVSAIVDLQHMELGTGLVLNQQTLAAKFPGVVVPARANVEWIIVPGKIDVTWQTGIGTNGVGTLLPSEGGGKSQLLPISGITTWAQFKQYVLTLEHWRFAFRGQQNSEWKLRSSFHRTGRTSLMRFMDEDVPALHRHLSGLTAHHFNLSDPLDYAAFLNLVQHHGYPTPILDWTQSPFVAAYFAFEGIRSRSDEGAKVRIFIMNVREWNVSSLRAHAMMPGHVHLTFLEPLATNNPRVVPQQSISAITNLDDIEDFCSQMEQMKGKTFLSAIDLPVSERPTVMHELALMGITAGSLFPGIEGACRQLRERLFDLA